MHRSSHSQKKSILSKSLNKKKLMIKNNNEFQSIKLAHENLTPAKIFYNEGTVENSNINRSPQSYLLNPEDERIK